MVRFLLRSVGKRILRFPFGNQVTFLWLLYRNDLLSRVDGTERLLELLDDGSFLKVYVESMLKDSSGDSRRAELPAANHRAATRF